jgi:Predicted Fe-S-cluster redox enzyme
VSVKKWLLENRKDMQNPLTNIMYMGQGEPLHNFDAVKKATHIFLYSWGLDFAPRKISLSTVGHVPALKRWHELPAINLSVSLHAATDELRDTLMPINKNHNLKELVKVLKGLSFSGRKKISFEYIMIQDQNDREQDIYHLIELLKDIPCQINLIPTNSFPGSSFQSSPLPHIYEFKRGLTE